MMKQGYDHAMADKKKYKDYSIAELNSLAVKFLREYQNTGNEFMMGAAYAVIAIIDEKRGKR